MTSTVPAVLFGTYTRGGRSQSGQGTVPDSVLAWTLNAGSGRPVGCTSGAGSCRAGSMSAVTAPPVVTGGAVQTTANTTAAGLKTATTKTKAKKMRTMRERRAPATAPRRLLVRKIFKFRGQLADPSPVVEAANEAGVTLVAGDVQELLLGDERSEAGQVGVCAVAHDPADHTGELAPLALRQGLPIAGDRDQQRGGRTGDCLGEDLFPLRPRDDLAPGADDVRDAISANANNVPAAPYGGSFEVSRPCVHCHVHYSS